VKQVTKVTLLLRSRRVSTV